MIELYHLFLIVFSFGENIPGISFEVKLRVIYKGKI